MKLKQLKKTIHSNLTIIDHYYNKRYNKVGCYDETFEALKNREVIGIRAEKDTLLVSIS